MSSSADSSVSDEMQRRTKVMEEHAVELMMDGKTNPKDAMDISGCGHEVGSKEYNRLYMKAYRKRKNVQKAQNVKRLKSLHRRNQKLSANHDSIQQLKRAVNNAVTQSKQSMVNQKGMQRQIDKLQKKQEATTQQLRAVARDNVSLMKKASKKASKTKRLEAQLGSFQFFSLWLVYY